MRRTEIAKLPIHRQMLFTGLCLSWLVIGICSLPMTDLHYPSLFVSMVAAAIALGGSK